MIDNDKYVFTRYKLGRIKIGDQALYVLTSFIQSLPEATEAGGVLLGRFILNGNDIVVDDVTPPHNKDKRYRNRFIRNQQTHQEEIVKRWKESNGTCNYLGEWHTHPEPVPRPSNLDLRDWKRILKQARVDSESLFFVIVGTEQLCVWEGCRETLLVKPLTFSKEDLSDV